jgi:CcmD family protein
MKQNLINKTILLLLALSPFFGFAQDSIEMADLMRSNGKIYVVVGVLLVIFIGIASYILMLDKRISKLEKTLKKKES